MTRTPLVLLLLLLLLVAAAAWLVGGSDEAPPAMDPIAEAVLDGPLDGPGAPAAPATTKEGATETDPAAAVDASSEGQLERTAAEPEPPSVTGPRALVVRGDPPMPVANVDVYFVTEADARRVSATRHLDLGRFEQPEALGQRVITDEQGLAQLPPTRAPWLCAAKTPTEFAFAMLPPRNRTVTMVLQADETVTVHAVLATGKPAVSVPVAVLQQITGRNEAQPVWQGTAGKDGRATARHFQLLRENPDPAPPEEHFLALAKVPTGSPVSAEFVGRPATADAIELALPPLGSVAVRLVDHRGTPLISPAMVGLVVDPMWADTGAIPIPRHLGGQRAEKPVGLDPVLLPFVEAGTQIRVYARYENERRPAVLGPVPGPTRADEVLALDLPLSHPFAVAAGAVVDARDAPVPEPVSAVLWCDGTELLTMHLPMLNDGRFDFVCQGHDDSHEYLLELRCERSSKPAGDVLTTRLGARVRVPSLRQGERVELGTIRLSELPPLVSGIVVDDQGTPVANADVQVQQEQAANPNDPRSRASWRPVSLLQTRSGDDGSFRIDGPLPSGTLRVRADTNLHFADAVPLSMQGQVVRIQIDRNGILRGRVLLPDWIADGTVSLQLQPFDEAERRSNTRTVELSRRRGGRFTIEPLRPGRFDARVLVRNVHEPLAVIQDVFVQPGETRDERLRLLDLSQALQRYRLRALDQAGQPLPIDGPIRARLSNNDGSISEAGFRWRGGSAELITGATSAELTFFGRGYRPQTVTFGPGDHDVYLEVLRPVMVEVPGARALCGPDRMVRVSVLLEGDTGLPASLGGIDQRTGERFSFPRWDLGRSSGGWLGNTDTVEIPLMQSGTYEVLLRPHQGNSQRTQQASISLGKYPLVIDPSGLNVVHCNVDAAALQQALQAMDERAAQQAATNTNNRGPGAPGPRGR